MTADVTEVYIYSEHSDLHRGFQTPDGEVATFEGCNADDLDPATKTIEARPLELLPPQHPRCKRCFPFSEATDAAMAELDKELGIV